MTAPWEPGGLHLTDIDITIRGVGREDERTRYFAECLCGWKSNDCNTVRVYTERIAAHHEAHPADRNGGARAPRIR